MFVSKSTPVSNSLEALSRSTGLQTKLTPLTAKQKLTRLGHRSSQTGSETRARWGFSLRGTNPVVTGVSGSTTSTYYARNMHNGGRWDFFRNGAFRFTPNGLGVYASSTLFPVTGRYRINGKILRFSGSRAANTLTSRTSVSIVGAISLRNGAARINQHSVSIMAANVNNTGFGQTVDRTVGLSLRMVRIA